MITNERQYKISRTQAARFEQALKEFNELALIEQGLDPLLIKAQRNALTAQLGDLSSQIEQYEALKSGRIKSLSASTMSQVGQKLIEARIAQGFTQKDLANRLGMKEQQIQRYENERYASASLSRLVAIATALDIHFQLDLALEPPKDSNESTSATPIDVSKLPVKTIKNRGWLAPFGKFSPSDFVPHLMRFIDPAFQNEAPALLRQGARFKDSFDEYALLAWKARIIWKAREERPIPSPNFGDLSWLQSFKEFTTQKNGPALAVEYLRTKGILVLFEGHLPKTHLDGAALLVDQDIYTIALTLRHDRLDNFWFVLLHELGHIIQHRDSGLKRGFFDEDASSAVDQLEREADEFAKSILLPTELWRTSLIRFTQSAEQIVTFANENRVSPAIVAGWIRRERNDYAIFKELVGYGKVRAPLKEAGMLETANVGDA